MKRYLPALLLPAALLALAPLPVQAGAGATPAAPTPAEVAALPADTRQRQQTALKAVWLERLIRTREERHRVTRENVVASVLQAQRAGAPAAFVSMLRREVAGNMSAAERHALESARESLLAAYNVSSLEMRMFVEAAPCSAAELRELAAWLPLASVFNLPPAAEAAPTTVAALSGLVAEVLDMRREKTAILSSAQDRASADAAAEALLPLLTRYAQARSLLMKVSPMSLQEAFAPHGSSAEAVYAAEKQELARLHEQQWFGSLRLRMVEGLMY